MSKKVKIFAIVSLIIAVIVFVSSRMGSSTPTTNPDSPLTSSNLPDGVQPAVSGVGSGTEGAGEFAVLLSSVQMINIDTSILNNIAYRSLRDYPVTLGTDTVGRTNPFAPIGTDAGAPAIGSQPLQDLGVQTLQPGKVTKNSAEFGAQVTLTDAAPVSVVFEYGTTDTFGSITAPVSVTKSGTVLATVSNLLPQTGFVVRAIVIRGSSTVTGNTISFTTL